MSEQAYHLWRKLTQCTASKSCLHRALQFTQYNLQTLVDQSFEVEDVTCHTCMLDQLSEFVPSPEDETVAVYIQIGDTLLGHAILIIPMANAYQMAEWLLHEPVTPSGNIDPLMSSALAETGNVLIASFLNALSQLNEHTSILPSPPAVIVDMFATVMQVVATAVATTFDEVTIIEADFKHTTSDLFIRLWLLPDPTTFIMARR